MRGIMLNWSASAVIIANFLVVAVTMSSFIFPKYTPPKSPIKYDPLKKYPSAEKVLAQLIPKCTLYFYGDPYHTPVFRRFLDICTSFANNKKSVHYCHTLQTSSNYSATFSSSMVFSAITNHLTRAIATASLSRKYSEQCLVLLPYLQDFDPSRIAHLTRITLGRVGAEFVFVVTPENPRNADIFLHNHTHFNYVFFGKSILFLVHETEHCLFFLCQPCVHDTLVEIDDGKSADSQSSSTSTIPPFNFGSPGISGFKPSIYQSWLGQPHTISFGQAINLNEQLRGLDGLKISRIESLWRKLHGDLGFYSMTSNEPIEEDGNQKLISRVCGKIRRSMYEYVIKVGRNENFHHRVSDPQEHCLYSTILSRHNFTGYSFTAKSLPRRLKSTQVPFLQMMAYKTLGPDVSIDYFQRWERGEYFLSGGVIKQGYHFTMFVNKKSIHRDFDVWALLRPLDTTVWMVLLLAICILSIILQIFSRKFRQLNIVAIFLEQDIVFVKIWKNGRVYLILAAWMFASNQLRLAYTASMYSFLAAESTPEVEQNLEEIVSQERKGTYKIFVSHEESKYLFNGIDSKIRNLHRDNGSEYIFLSTLSRAAKNLFEDDLAEFIPNKTFSENDHNHDDHSQLLNKRFALISQTHPLKKVHETWAQVHMSDHFSKWRIPVPFETIFITCGKYIRRKGVWKKWGGVKWILPHLLAFSGVKTFVTEYFSRDLERIVQSGIYDRWERLMNEYLKEAYLMKNMNLKYMFAAKTASYASLPSFSYDKNNRRLDFRKVNNYSLRAVWGVYLLCIILSGVMYLKEIVRFDLPVHSD